MRRKTFFFFVSPSLLLMLLFIAGPLISVFWQSFHVTRDVVEIVDVETCTASIGGQRCAVEKKTRPILDEEGIPIQKTDFVGLETYRSLLQLNTLRQALASETTSFWQALLNIDFFKALRFTITFALITLPLVIILGLSIALAVDNVVRSLRGSVIFISLLPFIVTPVIGALSIRWLFIGDGIITVFLERLIEADIAVFANGWAVESLMLFYRVWHVAPFAFVIFYAGLQTVNHDVMESSIIDGASRFQRLRYVIIPHLMPLVLFVSLIHLMDAYRVFEEIVGFSSQAHRISLQWLTYSFLASDLSGNRAISSASASAMLTMIGIVLLMMPLMMRVRRDHKQSTG